MWHGWWLAQYWSIGDERRRCTTENSPLQSFLVQTDHLPGSRPLAAMRRSRGFGKVVKGAVDLVYVDQGRINTRRWDVVVAGAENGSGIVLGGGKLGFRRH